MPRVRAAVSVVVLRDETVLLVRRGRPPGAGRWAPVGGRVEPGEALEAAALREVAEETGVAVRLLGRCGTREIASTDGDGTPMVWILEIFAAAWVAGEPVAGDDAAEARFVPIADLAAFDLVDRAGEAVAAARRLVDGSPPPEGLRNA